MSLYLDLLPPPQFDRSLVTYTVANFNRIKDLFIRSSARVYNITMFTNGPWPKTFTIQHPFKADVVAVGGASLVAPVSNPAGVRMTLDGNFVGMWGYTFFNLANVHMYVPITHSASGMSAAQHVWGVEYAANATSDSFDWVYIALFMTEVP